MTNFCPLCMHTDFRKSWLSTHFLKTFQYYECQNCGSLVCSPMPDNETLLEMYSVGYFEADESNMFERVRDYLKTLEKGVFIDYGCGSGKFAEIVYGDGWKTIGVEFNPESVEKLSEIYPFEIAGVSGNLSVKADVIHLADVLEHLTDLESQMPHILTLVKPGGVMIAHGPLEANPNLFQKFVKFSRIMRGGSTTGAPFHVMLATTKGQLSLFERFGLQQLEFDVRQIDFPAPERFTDSRGLRQAGLYLIRKISRFISSKNNGNHYFYIGKLP